MYFRVNFWREYRWREHYCLRNSLNASLGTLTLPICLIFFLPSFCFSSNFLFLVTSPPYNLAVTSFLKAFIVSLAIILDPIAAWIGISNCCLGIKSDNFFNLLNYMGNHTIPTFFKTYHIIAPCRLRHYWDRAHAYIFHNAFLHL